MRRNEHAQSQYDRQLHGVHNLSKREDIADPRLYAEAVAELGPLFYDTVAHVWVCTGYRECVEILADHKVFSSARPHSAQRLQERGLGAVSDISRVLSLQMLFSDPPNHAVLRSVLAKEFTPVAVRRQDAVMQQIVAEVLAEIPPGTMQVDLVADFAAKLPTRLIARLLGMQSHAEQLPVWADAYEKLIGSVSTLPHVKDQSVLPVLEHAQASFREVAEHRLADPGDDLISVMVTGLAGVVEYPVEVAVANCLVMMAGGYQTLTQLVVGGLLLLSEHADQLQSLREEPALVAGAVDEIMRLDGSSQYVARRAATDVTVAGRHIAAGETVLVMLAAANLDAREFTDPHRFDIRRAAGRHLGFGRGRHYCLGAPHAERLGQFALLAFLERFPVLRLIDAPEWGPHANTRCPARAVVDVSPPAAANTADLSAPLETWNDTDTPLGACRLWHQLFERHVRRSPEAVAVDTIARTWTYREINESANALAWQLRDQGVEPECTVGVVMDRSVSMVVSMLAVAKAGGAFMLADAACPPERLAVMAEEASVRLILTDTASSAKAQATGCDVHIPDVQQRRDAAPVTGVHTGNTAYVVFTSGTTGRPKGIAISHEGVVNLHRAQRDVLRPGPTDRVLQFLSPNFDGCVFEVIMALLSGATLVVEPAARLTVGPSLVRLLADRRISIVTMTPSVWAALPAADLVHLRVAAAAGEKLPAATAAKWLRPGRRFLNLYGPAEAAVWSTWHECDGRDSAPPIGRPVANKRVYVLDDNGKPAPVGHDGELWIGGLGIGRYLGRPDLMAKAFHLDRFADEGGLLYRTGDMCQWRADGVLEYRGRRDRQAKIRGQRVELDEVERVLDQAPGVVACAVSVADERLTAVVVPQGPWSEAAVKQFLADRLHSGMVPAAFRLVEQLPRSLNGKADPLAGSVHAPGLLPLPDGDPEVCTAVNIDTETSHLSTTRLTWRISQLFATCLQVPQHHVKCDSDFFDIGGDSLTVAEFLTGLQQDARVSLDVEALLSSPTPAKIAALVTDQLRSSRL